jgi:hypothetical protein
MILLAGEPFCGLDRSLGCYEILAGVYENHIGFCGAGASIIGGVLQDMVMLLVHGDK